MALSNFSDLKTTVANFLDKDDLNAHIPDFIRLAEVRMKRLRTQGMVERHTATLSTSSQYIATPARFLEMRLLFLDTSPRHRLEYRTPEQMTSLHQAAKGKPNYYTVIGPEVQFNRISDSAYTAEMWFYQEPIGLSDANTTNTIITNFPDIYLYGSLIAAEVYLKNDPRLNLWKQLYEEAVDQANEVRRAAEQSGSAIVSIPDVQVR